MFVWHVHPQLCCMWQAKDMKEEREGLLQDMAKLKAALQQLAARHQGMLYTYPHGQMLIHKHMTVVHQHRICIMFSQQ